MHKRKQDAIITQDLLPTQENRKTQGAISQAHMKDMAQGKRSPDVAIWSRHAKATK